MPPLWARGVLAIWVLVGGGLLILLGHRLAAGLFYDTDDYMRLIEVRDWIGGQSWFDVSQHRMDPPIGGSMHWSRLVDLPLAAGFVGLAPLLGRHGAEAATVAAVPLALLAGVLLTLGWIVRRLGGSQLAAAGAALLVVTSPFVMAQLFPSRIDHHGWQMLFALAAVAGLLAERRTPGGAAAGLALAAGLTVSIEGLPVAAAIAGATALRSLLDPAETRRTAALATGLAAGATLLYAATHLVWTTRWCDAVNPAHLAAFWAVAAGAVAALWARGRIAHALILAVGAGAGALLLAAIAPRCLAPPFATLDPLVRAVWYEHIMEGLPIWRQPPSEALSLLVLPILGTIGAARAARAGRRADWMVVALVACAALAVAVMVKRAGGFAHLAAAPGAIALIVPLLARVRRSARLIVRTAGAAVVVAAPSPLLAQWVGSFADRPVPPIPTLVCDQRCALAPLAALPPGLVLAPLDMGAVILGLTPHSIVAGGYHRNDRAMAEVIRAFIGDPAAAGRTIARRRIRYVALSRNGNEASSFRRLYPRGFAARLLGGRAPPWLVPVAGHGDVAIWRVVTPPS